MPGYLDDPNLPVNSDDVEAIAKHIIGEQQLADQKVVRADLDHDGQVSAADLLLMLRLMHGPSNLAIISPFVNWVEPSILAPGGEITIHGVNFGTSSADIQVQLFNYETEMTLR